MRQIHKLINSKAMHKIILQDHTICRLGLTNNPLRPRVVQENIMHQARPPRGHSMCPTEPDITNQTMPTTIEVIRIIVSSKMIFLRPIDLEVREGSVIPLCEDGKGMGILVKAAEILPVLIESAGFVPALGNTRIVLPVMEKLEVLRVVVVQRHHGEHFIQMRDVAGVDQTSTLGLRRADGVTSVHPLTREFGRSSVFHGEGEV